MISTNISEKINPSQGVSFLESFVEFIKKFGVIGLALGVVIGNAVKVLVDSLVQNIISPLIAKVFQQAELASWVIWDIKIGAFLSDFINFLILLFIVYFAVKLIIGRFLTEDEKKQLKMD